MTLQITKIIRFVDWLDSKPSSIKLTLSQIMTEFNCSRGTAKHWLSCYIEVRGQAHEFYTVRGQQVAKILHLLSESPKTRNEILESLGIFNNLDKAKSISTTLSRLTKEKRIKILPRKKCRPTDCRPLTVYTL